MCIACSQDVVLDVFFRVELTKSMGLCGRRPSGACISLLR